MKTSEILTSAYKYLWNGDIYNYDYGYAPCICEAVSATRQEYYNSTTEWMKCYRKFSDHIDSIIWDTTMAAYYSSHLDSLGVSKSLTNNPEWMQLRRRELLCNIISHFETLGD